MRTTTENLARVQTGAEMQTQRLAAFLQAGEVEAFNSNRPKGALDLSGLVLPKGTDLTGVNLSKVKLEQAQLPGVVLNNANLDGADFSQARLNGAHITNSSANSANFDRATLSLAVINNVDFGEEAGFQQAQLVKTSFEICKIPEGKFQSAVLNNSCFLNCQLGSASFSTTQLTNTSFEGSNLTGAIFDQARFNKTNFTRTTLTGASFNQSRGISPNFADAILNDANMIKVHFKSPNFARAFVKGMKHDFGEQREEFLGKAYADKDPDLQKYLALQTQGSNLINGVPGTDAKLLDSVMVELDNMIGLDEVKQIIRDFINEVRLNHMSSQLGMPTKEFKVHMAFLGEPGVGKTTVARMFGKIFKAFGFLEQGEVIELPGRELVVGKVGQTEEKTREYITKAMGNILFVDEAPQLASSSDVDFGRHAIGTINHSITNNPGKFVVIVAGYSGEPMDKFFAMDKGFRSRMTYIINFPGYSPGELTDIFVKQISSKELIAPQEMLAGVGLVAALNRVRQKEEFGNARFIVDELFTKVYNRRNQRLVSEGVLENRDKKIQREKLTNLQKQDLAVKEVLGCEQADFEALLKTCSWTTKSGQKLTYEQLLTYQRQAGEPFPELDIDKIDDIYSKLIRNLPVV